MGSRKAFRGGKGWGGKGKQDINVDACEAYLVFAHSPKKGNFKFHFNGISNVGGYIGCDPKANNPAIDSSQRWPNLPEHELNMGMEDADGDDDKRTNKQNTDAMKGDMGGETMARNPGAAEMSSVEALKNALSPDAIKKIRENLCNNCCEEVAITIHVISGSAVESVIKKTFPNLPINQPITKKFDCENPFDTDAMLFKEGMITKGLWGN